jgi:hypothetical protein
MNMPFILNAGNNTGGNPESAYSSALIGGMINGFFSGSIQYLNQVTIQYMHLHGLLQDSIILLYKNMVLKQYPGLQL